MDAQNRGPRQTDVVKYQSPGGWWDDAADGSDRPPACGFDAGMALDEGQEAALITPQAERNLVQHERLQAAVVDGLLYTGWCPRCGHRMRAKFTFGVLVDDLTAGGAQIRWTCDPKEPFRWVMTKLRPTTRSRSRGSKPPLPPKREEDQCVESLTFVCSCGEPHEGRPDAAAFAGCGAVWLQPALGPALAGTKIPVRGGTPQDAERAEEARLLSQRSLDRIRAEANQWRTASGSLTAVLAAATLIGAPQAGRAPTLATGILAVAGFVLLFGGTVVSALAASAVSGYDHRLLTPTVLGRYERDRGAKAIRQIQQSMIAIFVGVILLAGSGIAALLT